MSRWHSSSRIVHTGVATLVLVASVAGSDGVHSAGSSNNAGHSAVGTVSTTEPNAALALDLAPGDAVEPVVLTSEQRTDRTGLPAGMDGQAVRGTGRDPVNDIMVPRAGGLVVENIPILRTGATEASEAVQVPWYRSGAVSLLVVLGVIVAAALLAKRVFKSSHILGGDTLRVLCRSHLSSKQSVALMQMGGKLVFVGITSESIRTLRTVEDAEEAALLRGQLRAGTLGAGAGETQFDKVLTREADRFPAGLEGGSEFTPQASERMTRTREDLKGLLKNVRSYQGR